MAKEPEIPPNSRLSFDDLDAPCGLTLGDDVVVECRRLRVGRDVIIGGETPESFRVAGGVRIRAEELVLGDGVRIDRGTHIRGGVIHLGEQVRIRDGVTIAVQERLVVGAGGTVGHGSEIVGLDVAIGRRLWMLSDVKIGGGSAGDRPSRLRIGDFGHLGMHTFINTARPVTIGDEVGLGTRTALYTHGAWPSVLRGGPAKFAPVSIGDRSWLPGASVNPGVNIGADVVVAVGSVVTRDLPSGCLAGGVPAKVLREGVFPRVLSPEERETAIWEILETFAELAGDRHEVSVDVENRQVTLDGNTLILWRRQIDDQSLARHPVGAGARCILLSDRFGVREVPDNTTFIDPGELALRGRADALADRLVNQLRRYGIRFRYEADGGRYGPWPPDPMRLTP